MQASAQHFAAAAAAAQQQQLASLPASDAQQGMVQQATPGAAAHHPSVAMAAVQSAINSAYPPPRGVPPAGIPSMQNMSSASGSGSAGVAAHPANPSAAAATAPATQTLPGGMTLPKTLPGGPQVYHQPHQPPPAAPHGGGSKRKRQEERAARSAQQQQALQQARGQGGLGAGSGAAAAGAGSSAIAREVLDRAAPSAGPSIAVPCKLTWQQAARLPLALQSGVAHEANWALNTLGVLSYQSHAPLRLEEHPGLLDSLLYVVMAGLADVPPGACLPRSLPPQQSTAAPACFEQLRAAAASNASHGSGGGRGGGRREAANGSSPADTSTAAGAAEAGGGRAGGDAAGEQQSRHRRRGGARAQNGAVSGGSSLEGRADVAGAAVPWWERETSRLVAPHDGAHDCFTRAVAASNVLRNLSADKANAPQLAAADCVSQVTTALRVAQDLEGPEASELLGNLLDMLRTLSPTLSLPSLGASTAHALLSLLAFMARRGEAPLHVRGAAVDVLAAIAAHPGSSPMLHAALLTGVDQGQPHAAAVVGAKTVAPRAGAAPNADADASPDDESGSGTAAQAMDAPATGAGVDEEGLPGGVLCALRRSMPPPPTLLDTLSDLLTSDADMAIEAVEGEVAPRGSAAYLSALQRRRCSAAAVSAMAAVVQADAVASAAALCHAIAASQAEAAAASSAASSAVPLLGNTGDGAAATSASAAGNGQQHTEGVIGGGGGGKGNGVLRLEEARGGGGKGDGAPPLAGGRPLWRHRRLVRALVLLLVGVLPLDSQDLMQNVSAFGGYVSDSLRRARESSARALTAAQAVPGGLECLLTYESKLAVAAMDGAHDPQAIAHVLGVLARAGVSSARPGANRGVASAPAAGAGLGSAAGLRPAVGPASMHLV